MPDRIVLYGATGYIGALTAQAMLASGPVLADRDQAGLNTLAARLSQAGAATQLETTVAETETPEPLRHLLGARGVLVSTADTTAPRYLSGRTHRQEPRRSGPNGSIAPSSTVPGNGPRATYPYRGLDARLWAVAAAHSRTF